MHPGFCLFVCFIFLPTACTPGEQYEKSFQDSMAGAGIPNDIEKGSRFLLLCVFPSTKGSNGNGEAKTFPCHNKVPFILVPA